MVLGLMGVGAFGDLVVEAVVFADHPGRTTAMILRLHLRHSLGNLQIFVTRLRSTAEGTLALAMVLVAAGDNGDSTYTPYNSSGITPTGSSSYMSQNTGDLVPSFSSDHTPTPYFQQPSSPIQTSRSFFSSDGLYNTGTSQLNTLSPNLQQSTGSDLSGHNRLTTDGLLSSGSCSSESHYYSARLPDIDPEVPSETGSWVDHRSMSPSTSAEFSSSIVTSYGASEESDIEYLRFWFGSRNPGESSNGSNHSSGLITELASIQGNIEDFISDMASDMWNGLQNSSENEAGHNRKLRQSLGRPVTMEDGSDDDGPTMVRGDDWGNDVPEDQTGEAEAGKRESAKLNIEESKTEAGAELGDGFVTTPPSRRAGVRLLGSIRQQQPDSRQLSVSFPWDPALLFPAALKRSSSVSVLLPARPYLREMWNDEDNNPYGSFDRHDSSPSAAVNPSSPTAHLNRPATPTSATSSNNNEPPEFVSHPPDLSDDDGDDYPERTQSGRIPRKKGGYDSRIEQILYENPDLPIFITDAGKNHESGGSYIVYTIRTGVGVCSNGNLPLSHGRINGLSQDLEVRRRYSEFSSLRATLVNLHPTLIIPPIPEKHSMADYAAKPTKAKEDMGIIDLRKRMLSVFLNRCRRMREVREDGVWWRFLDPNASWSEVLHSPPVSSLPKSVLKAPPLDPANPSQAHTYLPVPSANAKLRSSSITSGTGLPSSPPRGSFASSASHTIPGPQIFGRFPPNSKNLGEQDLDPYFINFEASTRELEVLLQGNIEKVNRRTLTHLSSLAADLAELGARYNGFSLSEPSPTLATAIERIGQAVDSSYIATEELSASLGASFAEPMRESAQFAGVVRSVLRYRVLKRVQEEMTRDELAKKKALLESLERSEMEAKRIDQYLSSTGAPSSTPKRTASSASARGSTGEQQRQRRGSLEDTASIDSDFPPTHGDAPSPS
ncbi:hypothetical protein GP486_006164, partial [Trichoglossum hirsutum]